MKLKIRSAIIGKVKKRKEKKYMCDKHSFLLSSDSKIYHGFGVISRHTIIARLHQIDENKCNKYEYDPLRGPYRLGYGIVGLRIYDEIFAVSKSQIDIIENYIKEMFPDLETFDNYSKFNTAPGMLDRLSTDEDWEFRRAVAGNKNTSPETLHRLAGDAVVIVREAVALNRNTTAETLDKLSWDGHWRVRRAVAGNKNTSPETLHLLDDDV